MTRVVLTAAVLVLGSVAWAQKKEPPTPVGPPVRGGASGDEATCSRHGTAIDFLPTPGAAAAAAKKNEKLVFVLHLSGHFEDPGFT